MSPTPAVEPLPDEGDVDARLQALIARVWAPSAYRDASIQVRLGRPSPGFVPTEEYAVIPSASRPRFLVPLGSRRVAVSSFRKYNAMKAPRTRAVRAALGVAFAGPWGEQLFRDRLLVSVREGVPAGRLPDLLIMRHLGDVLNRPQLMACMSVRRLNPNAKVTLQLFEPSGVPVGYAKLGSSDATKALVRTEATALSALGGRVPGVIVPRLLESGSWHDVEYAIGSPLPEDLRRWNQEPAAAPQVILAVATSGKVTETTLRQSPYLARLREQLSTTAAAQTRDAADVLGAWLNRLAASTVSLRFGRSHGDWMPYNLGHRNGEIAAWDWEHSAVDSPIGFDLLHWYFQHAMDSGGMTSAVAAVDSAAPGLAGLGVAPEARSLVVSLYLLDVFVRRMQLAIGGGGWNSRWYPAMLRVAAARDLPRT